MPPKRRKMEPFDVIDEFQPDSEVVKKIIVKSLKSN